jgi:polysaccharide deacetylase 2 family uncharacterized protein YibQ
MEPLLKDVDPGPNALLTRHGETELIRRLRWDLSRFDGYVGISNHMGSRFTTDPEAMRVVLREVKARGLLFLDSRTTADTVAASLAAEVGVPHASRDLFIDRDPTAPAIRVRLSELEALARLRGAAVGIAHPYDATLDVLEAWLPEVRRRGILLVPVSAIVRRRAAPASGGALAVAAEPSGG